MQLTFLGTSAMVPTKTRNHAAVFLSYKTHGVLFDCGEGTQRQFKIAGIPLTKVTKVLITHWHGDHTLGLAGLIQSLGASEYTRTLDIYGPKGTKKHLRSMMEGISSEARIRINVTELESGIFYDGKDYTLECMPLKHGVPCIGYAFQEKDRRRIRVDVVKKLGIPEGPLLGELQRGKTVTFKGKKVTPSEATRIVKGRKVAYITDTLLVPNCVKLAENADVLVCESSYASALKSKADEYKHMTARDAGLIASQSKTKKLYLTHFSPRYKSTLELEEDARVVFDNVFCAEDLMKVTI